MYSDKVKLSILVTFCNQKEFIKTALDSCVNQKINFNYEILIGLDNPDIESEKIIQGYIKKYSNIKLFKIDNSKLNITNIEKASRNRMNLIKNAKGEYLSFLDGDDFYCDIYRQQIMVDFLDDSPQYIAACHDLIKFDNKTQSFIDSKSINKNAKIYNLQDYFNETKQFSCFIYRNIFKNVKNEHLDKLLINDTSLTSYYFRYGDFYFIPRKMFAYRLHEKSIFSSKGCIEQKLYALLCGEINSKLLPQYQKKLCKKYAKTLKINFKNIRKFNEIDKNELLKIKNFAQKYNSYFTYNLLNYSNLNLYEKIKLYILKFIFIYFRLNLSFDNSKNKKLFYFNARPNFGDELNIYILQRLFNLNIKKESFKKADLIGIGSILDSNITSKQKNMLQKNKPLKVFSSGIIEEKKQKEFLKRKCNFLALRGKYTKSRIENILKKKINCPLGDGGLLASELLETMPKKEYRVGVILHYVDKKSSFLKNIKLENCKLIDISKNPIYILNEIAKCEVILSSAMHGLIVADSLNIPNQWIKLGDILFGGDYKFKDYYSIYSYEPKAIDLRNEIIDENTIEKIKENYKNLNFYRAVQKTKKELLEAGNNL